MSLRKRIKILTILFFQDQVRDRLDRKERMPKVPLGLLQSMLKPKIKTAKYGYLFFSHERKEAKVLD